MDEQNQNNFSEQKNKGGAGSTIAIVIVVLVLILGALYVFGKREMPIPELTPLGIDDSIETLEKDLENTTGELELEELGI